MEKSLKLQGLEQENDRKKMGEMMREYSSFFVLLFLEMREFERGMMGKTVCLFWGESGKVGLPHDKLSNFNGCDDLIIHKKE